MPDDIQKPELKNNQHYVFQSYLKAWTDDRNELWECKRGREKIIRKGTKSTLSAFRTYELKDLNDDELQFWELCMDVFRLNDQNKQLIRNHINMYLTPFRGRKIVDGLKAINPIPKGHPDYQELERIFGSLELNLEEAIVNTDEDFFSDYENDGKKWFDRIMEGDLSFYYPESDGASSPDYTERNDFITFICIQYFRTIEMRNVMTENIQNMITNSINLKDYVFDRTKVRADHILPQYSWMFFIMISVGFTSRNAHLTVLHNKTSLPFITCDQPVINLKSEKGKELKEFVIFYPLSPDVAIIVNDESVHKEKVIDNKMIIDDFNRKMIEHFDKYLISNKKEVLEGMREMYL
ncbi:DUF4238 domain-containing protein [Oribacterium sp. NK2B42]|uniref:DUF4238 domain-containing protein n=1 Tax=Oribacterium sp. NK2B42 TaxID=689781 RepID=UPI000420F522|nr:DUF4238 domain-containing protein [Oribacterium sp. NK2B42]